MGCCGCSLAASARVAVALGMIESLVGMGWNILVLVIIETEKTLNKTETTTALENIATTLPPDVEYESTIFIPDDVYNATNWESFKRTITSDAALKTTHLFELSIAALAVNSFWFLTTIALAIGNAKRWAGMLRPWIFTTIIVTILDIAATIYFIFKAIKDTSEHESVDIGSLFFHNIFVILAVLFSRGGPIIWVTNVYYSLCISVAQRMNEIEMPKKKRLPFDSDMRISPYTLHSGYESYDAGSYRCEKSTRPSTPPPDYEAYQNRYGNGGHKKSNNNRRSSPSDGENSTLPVSLRSGQSSGRPLSACYPYDDDRVELQHRPSSLYQHAYDNKAMQMEQSESWMGIPRPTLKITR